MSYETALCVQRLKALAGQQGLLTYEQINMELPSSMIDPEKIAAIVDQLRRAGIRVVEHSSADKSERHD